jgi:membrane protease YdiL (CAAX protease family)
MRKKLAKYFTSKWVVLSIILIACLTMYFAGGRGYLFGLLIALITLWVLKWDWNYFGVDWKKLTFNTIVKALGLTLLILFISEFLLTPWVEYWTNTPHDYSSFEFLRGNLKNLLFYLVFVWVIAGFGEEFFYRGYFMRRIAIIFGDNKFSWILGLLLSSVAFGIVHRYQGISGMVTTGSIGLMIGFIYYKNRNNLVLCILIHGIMDTIGLILIYLGQGSIISETAKQLFKL